MSSPIKVLVVEDHFLARFALVSFLGGEAGMDVVAKTESGREAITLYRTHRPDVVLMDIMLAELDGLATTRLILQEDPGAKILILTSLYSGEDVHKAVTSGARGYLRKDVPGDVLLAGITRVAEGGKFFPPDVAEKMADRSVQSPLTPREDQVLQLLCKGLSNREIALALELKEGTVRIYISNLLVKLDARRRTEAVSEAIKRGLYRP
ncbi:MAG: response regulator transcription factor [Deltaproteobacteria bacterium]|nr:response regulator transcription factor [Deltaproteobacteria bacterium]